MDERVIYGPSGQEFTVGVLQEEYLMGVEKGRPLVTPLYDDRFMDYLVDLIKERPRHQFHCNIMVAGEPRTGKTSLTCQFARKVDPMFSISKVAFRLEDFVEAYGTNPFADMDTGVFPQSVADESGFAMYSQRYMDEEQINLNRLFQVTPIMNQISWFVLPHKDYLNKSIRDTMIQYWFQVVTHQGLRGFCKVREAIHSEFVKDVYWRPLAAFTFPPFPDPAWWGRYLSKKVAFVESVNADGLSVDANSREKRLIEQRNAAIRAVYLQAKKDGNPLSHKAVAERLKMPLSTVDSILNRAARPPSRSTNREENAGQ